MVITIQAVYEDGVLKPAQHLPFADKEQVEVTIRSPSAMSAEQATAIARDSYGMLGWKGDHETLQRLLDETEDGEDLA